MMITFIVLLVLLSTALVTFWVLLQRPGFQETLASKVEDMIPEPFNHDVQIGKIGGRLPGSFFIDEVKITLPRGDELSLSGLTFSWDWTALWDRRLVLNKLLVDELKIAVIQGDDGEWLGDLSGGETPPPKEEVLLEEDPSPLLYPELEVLLQTIPSRSFAFKAKGVPTPRTDFSFGLEELTLHGTHGL